MLSFKVRNGNTHSFCPVDIQMCSRVECCTVPTSARSSAADISTHQAQNSLSCSVLIDETLGFKVRNGNAPSLSPVEIQMCSRVECCTVPTSARSSAADISTHQAQNSLSCSVLIDETLSFKVRNCNAHSLCPVDIQMCSRVECCTVPTSARSSAAD